MSKKKRKLHPKYTLRRLVIIILLAFAVLATGWFFGTKSATKPQLGASESSQTDLPPPEQEQPPSAQQDTQEPEIVPVTELPKEAPDPQSWETVIVSASKPLDEDFNVELAQIGKDLQLDKRVEPIFKKMIAQAKSDGINLKVFGAYRSAVEQETLFNTAVEEYIEAGTDSEQAHEQAKKIVAEPWTSDFQTGLAVELSSPDIEVHNSFDQTAAFKWLVDNAADYGFVLRYPAGKEATTKVAYNACHFRYVGVENALQMVENGYSLEEFVYMQDKLKNPEIIGDETQSDATEVTEDEPNPAETQ